MIGARFARGNHSMRSFFRVGLIVLMVASAGCGLPAGPTGTGGSTGNGQGTQGTMSATIANVPWTANGRVTATYAPPQNNLAVSTLNISGQDSPLTQTLAIAVSAPAVGTALTPGTYQVSTAATNALLTVNTGTVTTFQASSPVGFGTVTITSFSTVTRTAVGSFTFVVVQSGGSAQKSINSGNFNVTF